MMSLQFHERLESFLVFSVLVVATGVSGRIIEHVEVADLEANLASSVTYSALQVEAERQCLSSFFSWMGEIRLNIGINSLI